MINLRAVPVPVLCMRMALFFIPVELALAVVDVCFNSVSLVWNENYIVGIFKITSVWYNSECFFHYVY